MSFRFLVLGIPSAVILAGLIWHSFRALPRQRATAFWISVLAYGVLRGLGVRWVTSTIGASFPYEIRNPLLSIGGIAAQEVAGWAIVAYLGWWIGARRPLLFLQIAWAALFLGAISWAIEAAAIAARWWHWTVPTASRVFINVPAIGIVDWFFVAIDFLLPFVAITGLRTRWRYLTLLFFPVHFAGHLLPGIWLHVIHWLLVIIAAWLALRSGAEDRNSGGPATSPARAGGVARAPLAWIPTAAVAVIAIDIAIVDAFVVRRPELLVSLVPLVLIWIAGLRGGRAPWLRRHWKIAIAAIVIAAVALHTKSARDRADLTRRLDRAVAERGSGNLHGALMQFDAIAADHPTSYVPLAFAAEIDYRAGRLDAAYVKLARAVDIKQDFIRGYRLLAAIDLQRGNTERGTAWASRGLEVAADDLQLRYLAGQDVTSSITTPEIAAGMAALAYEVGDTEAALRIAREWRLDAIVRRLERVSAAR